MKCFGKKLTFGITIAALLFVAVTTLAVSKEEIQPSVHRATASERITSSKTEKSDGYRHQLLTHHCEINYGGSHFGLTIVHAD